MIIYQPEESVEFEYHSGWLPKYLLREEIVIDIECEKVHYCNLSEVECHGARIYTP